MEKIKPVFQQNIEETLLSHMKAAEGKFDASEVFHHCLTKSICSIMFDMNTDEIADLYTQLEQVFRWYMTE